MTGQFTAGHRAIGHHSQVVRQRSAKPLFSGSNPDGASIKGLRYGYNRSGVFFCSKTPDIQGFFLIRENNETVQSGSLELGILFFSACADFSYTSGTKHFCFEWFV